MTALLLLWEAAPINSAVVAASTLDLEISNVFDVV